MDVIGLKNKSSGNSRPTMENEQQTVRIFVSTYSPWVGGYGTLTPPDICPSVANGGVNIMRILMVCCFLFIVGRLYISSAQ